MSPFSLTATMFSNAGSYFTTTQLQVIASLTSILLVYGIYKISTFIYDEVTCPVRSLPGPPSPNWLYGSFKEFSESKNFELQEGWINQYGTTIQYKAIFGTCRLMTTDLKAINYMLFNSYDYTKPAVSNYIFREYLGNGLLSVDGDVHKIQRKVLNPAFGPQQIRGLTEVFVEKALELRDIWSAEIVKHGGVGSMECLSWMGQTALDIIGIAGFNYKFNALSSDYKNNELMRAFSVVFEAANNISIIPVLKGLYPFLRFMPAPDDAKKRKAVAVMNRIGNQLLKQSTASQEDNNGSKLSSRKDLLALLIKANTNQDLPESQQLKDEDVVSQIPTFVVAGHETTSTAISWALYALTQNKQVQTKLRQELSTVSTDNPTMDDLNALPYLDAVVRETFRLYPSISWTVRAAQKDDCIPLSRPFTDKKGVVHNEIRVRKGQFIMLPIFLINRDKSIWGEDSTEFKPERWVNTPDAAAPVPGVWANVMTFLGGPRSCIGYRFSTVEVKAMIFVLVRAFEFDLAVPGKDMGVKASLIGRPVLLTDPDNSNQMPLLVRPVSSEL